MWSPSVSVVRDRPTHLQFLGCFIRRPRLSSPSLSPPTRWPLLLSVPNQTPYPPLSPDPSFWLWSCSGHTTHLSAEAPYLQPYPDASPQVSGVGGGHSLPRPPCARPASPVSEQLPPWSLCRDDLQSESPGLHSEPRLLHTQGPWVSPPKHTDSGNEGPWGLLWQLNDKANVKCFRLCLRSLFLNK